jgi:hypothetical protein
MFGTTKFSGPLTRHANTSLMNNSEKKENNVAIVQKAWQTTLAQILELILFVLTLFVFYSSVNGEAQLACSPG